MIKPEELEKIKANVIKFLGNGLISEKVIAMHLVIVIKQVEIQGIEGTKLTELLVSLTLEYGLEVNSIKLNSTELED